MTDDQIEEIVNFSSSNFFQTEVREDHHEDHHHREGAHEDLEDDVRCGISSFPLFDWTSDSDQ